MFCSHLDKMIADLSESKIEDFTEPTADLSLNKNVDTSKKIVQIKDSM